MYLIFNAKSTFYANAMTFQENCFVIFYDFVSHSIRPNITKKWFKSSVIRQKYVCVSGGVWNVRFLENLMSFVFSKHPFWDWPFCLIIAKTALAPIRNTSKISWRLRFAYFLASIKKVLVDYKVRWVKFQSWHPIDKLIWARGQMS